MLRQTLNWHSRCGRGEMAMAPMAPQSIDQLADVVAINGSGASALEGGRIQLASRDMAADEPCPLWSSYCEHAQPWTGGNIGRPQRAGRRADHSPSANAAYGLCSAGQPAVPALIECTRILDDWWLRAFAALRRSETSPVRPPPSRYPPWWNLRLTKTQR